jgi:pimeloyl-ACP methyl ester carboxylesterase
MGREIWRAAKWVLAAILTLVLLAIVGGLGYRTYRHHAINAATRIDPAQGIDEELFTTIGGIEQWIAIRGQDRENPVILFLHGGPGFSDSPLPRTFLFSWTRDFTVVFWDQRGAGKSYGRSGPVAPGTSIDRMAQDGVEVAEFVRARLHKKKIVLLGLSWGSMIGIKIAHARPDLFYAYVGTGQAVNQGKYKKIAYTDLLEEARRRNNAQAVHELEAIGPPPWTAGQNEGVHTKWANAFEDGQAAVLPIVLFESPAGPLELADYLRGLLSSDDYFRPQVNALDLPSVGTDFRLPVFIFQGALDHVTPVPPVLDYFERINAPRKDLVLIPGGGHSVMASKSDEFLRLLDDRVRPLTTSP